MTGLDPEKYLTINETAEALGVSRRTVYRYIGEGRLAAFKHAGRNYVEVGQIDDYFARLLAPADKARAERAKQNRIKA